MALGENGSAQITEGVKRFLFYWSRQPINAMFGQFYSTLPAYSEVYPAEIFSIDDAQVNADDAHRVRVILKANDPSATQAARGLISRWNSLLYPILNLELLLDVVGTGDDMRYDRLIRRNFDPDYSDFEHEPATERYCKSFEKHILPKADPAVHQVLFDFLPLLFPVEADGELDSPTVRAFRRFAAVAPFACIRALLRSLDYAFVEHRAFVWRLLTEQNIVLPDRVAVRARAEAELASAVPTAAVEIKRFLTRVPAS